jgi:hypothetical protein
VQAATEAGIPAEAIVPVVRAFGSECADNPSGRLPSADDLRQMLDRWARHVPDPKLEITYAWENLPGWTCPTLADADGSEDRPDLQSVMREHNRTGGGGRWGRIAEVSNGAAPVRRGGRGPAPGRLTIRGARRCA